jgi:hypothetical protein
MEDQNIFFGENDLLIPIHPEIALIDEKSEKENMEHFTEEDYQKVQSTLQKLKEKQIILNDKIKSRQDYVITMDEKYNKYKTFYHMFENTDQRNQSYVKMVLFLITIIFALILLIVSYFIYSSY